MKQTRFKLLEPFHQVCLEILHLFYQLLELLQIHVELTDKLQIFSVLLKETTAHPIQRISVSARYFS